MEVASCASAGMGTNAGRQARTTADNKAWCVFTKEVLLGIRNEVRLTGGLQADDVDRKDREAGDELNHVAQHVHLGGGRSGAHGFLKLAEANQFDQQRASHGTNEGSHNWNGQEERTGEPADKRPNRTETR